MIYLDPINYKEVEQIYYNTIKKMYDGARKLNLSDKQKLLKQFFEDFCDEELLIELELVDEKTILKNLILLSPEKIEKLVAAVDAERFRDDFEILSKKKPTDEEKERIKQVEDEVKAAYLLKEQYIKTKGLMSRSVDSDKGEMQMNMFLVESLAITVCPYCNRNFINNRGDKFSAQMDHFYSKDAYPFLAVSLYNLIPTCGACNNIKSTQDFHIHPFIKPRTEDEISFNYQYRSIKEMEIKIRTSDSRRNDIESIRLEEAYQMHHLDVEMMLSREERYSKKYREELRGLFQNNVMDIEFIDDEIDRMIYGDVIFEEDIKNISLGKFKKDIYQQIKSLRGY